MQDSSNLEAGTPRNPAPLGTYGVIRCCYVLYFKGKLKLRASKVDSGPQCRNGSSDRLRNMELPTLFEAHAISTKQ